jgi:hypothetical protein
MASAKLTGKLEYVYTVSFLDAPCAIPIGNIITSNKIKANKTVTFRFTFDNSSTNKIDSPAKKK